MLLLHLYFYIFWIQRLKGIFYVLLLYFHLILSYFWDKRLNRGWCYSNLSEKLLEASKRYFKLSESKAPNFPKILSSNHAEFYFAQPPISPNRIIGRAPISLISPILFKWHLWTIVQSTCTKQLHINVAPTKQFNPHMWIEHFMH